MSEVWVNKKKVQFEIKLINNVYELSSKTAVHFFKTWEDVVSHLNQFGFKRQ
ncbi:MAG: hypothetical protein ACYDBV_15100 [Nitrospiria bacterium]|jgi:hypothetical protein